MLRGATPAGVPEIALQTGPQADAQAARRAAWTAPASVAVLILGIYGLTAFAFAVMRALPVLASGSGH
jgi:hypothetical protein